MRYIILILFFLLAGAAVAHSQSRYHFSVLGVEQGLSNACVWSICQDKYGFMWMGTSYGLNRYDGHNIRQYINDPKDSLSIPGNTVFWLHKDSDGDLWAACGTGGVARYNYEKDRFEKLIPYENLRRQTGLPAPVWRVGEDQRRRIYIACGGALFRYTKTTGNIENMTPLFKGAIDSYGVAMFVQQGSDTLWILTDNGLFLHRLSANSIEHIAYDKEKFGVGSAAFIDGEFISRDEMILTTFLSGFVIFNVRTKSFRPAPPPLDPSTSKIYSNCGGLIKDVQGKIWIANSVYGLIEYTPQENIVSIKSFQSYPYPYPEQEGKGMNVYEDKDGNIWYCTSQQGVVWFQPKLDFVHVYKRDYANAASLAGDVVYGFLPVGEANHMFVATSNGLSRLNGAGEGFYNYPVSVTTNQRFPAASVYSFAASNDTVFMATGFGLSLYNNRTKNFQRYVLKDEEHPGKWELFSNQLSRVYGTTAGKLVLTTTYGTAARFELATGRCFHKGNADTTDMLYRFAGISCTAKDSLRRCLWIEAGEGELYSYDWTDCTATRHIYTADTSIKTISSIVTGTDGTLWLGTKKGIIHYSPATKISKLYALPTASQEVYNLACCSDGSIWVTTQNEVALLTPATGKSVAFNIQSVMPYAAITRRSVFVDAQNNAWLGTNRGFCVVDRAGFAPQTKISAPHLVNFRVFDKPKGFAQPYFELSDIALSWDENFFSFDFSALEFNQAAVPQYAYQLEPFDKNWMTSAKNSASYTNVPPGRYTLRLRTQGGLGKWEEAPPIRVRIHSPYWQRWWAVLLMLALLATGVYFLVRFRQKQKRNKLMEENAARATEMQLLEIKKLLAESQLMALRAQMNPHFVFNCLNSIQECIVTQKYGEASLYLNKFAKLFRSVLNNSGKVLVTLAEEIDVLDLYLTLEHMRFEKSFSYAIHIDDELEKDEILIPSMLLQPYVENALWHGLMHKQGDRRLIISFAAKSDSVFTCVIDDNGIGRTKALELKEQQSKTKRHVSRGMTISRDRIELLQKQQQHAVLEIIDKYDEAGAPTGTRVVVELSSFLE